VIVATAVLYDCRRAEDMLARSVSDLEQMYGDFGDRASAGCCGR
jgi:hypothetical protein